MRLLLDTQIFAWIASGTQELTKAERVAIEKWHDDLWLSAVSIWELRLKWRSKPRHAWADGLITAPQAIEFAAVSGITIAPFTAEVATTSLEPPLTHKDPFDDVLLVHAGLLGAKLLTRDGDCLAHPLAYQP